MSSDKVHALEELRCRLKATQIKSERLQANLERIERDLLAKRQEVLSLSSEQEVLTKVLELYRVLMDRLVLGQVQVIESIVSEGLATIFYDQGLSFKLEISNKYNRVSADPFICQGDIKGDPLDSFGGGPASIVSLILRIIVLLRLKRHRILFLDETLVAVSEEYIENTGLFLRKLAESSGLPTLLVTHKQSFLEHASSGYQGESKIEDGREHFAVRKIRGVG